MKKNVFIKVLIVAIAFILVIPTYSNAAVPGDNANYIEIYKYINGSPSPDLSDFTISKLNKWLSTLYPYATSSGAGSPEQRAESNKAYMKLKEEIQSRGLDPNSGVSSVPAENASYKEISNYVIANKYAVKNVPLSKLEKWKSILDNAVNHMGLLQSSDEYKNASVAYGIVVDCISSLGSNNSQGGTLPQNPIDDPGYYEPGSEGINPGDTTRFQKMGRVILKTINIVGVIISVLALAVIGIRYMWASLEEKANYKQTMVPYIIGVVLLAAGTTVVNIIYQVMSSFNS